MGTVKGGRNSGRLLHSSYAAKIPASREVNVAACIVQSQPCGGAIAGIKFLFVEHDFELCPQWRLFAHPNAGKLICP